MLNSIALSNTIAEKTCVNAWKSNSCTVTMLKHH